MSRAGLRGPRRTRVYDCNYNAGEKYYRPALDNLDRKYYGKWVQRRWHFAQKFQSKIRARINFDRFSLYLTRPLASERIQSPARPTIFGADPFNDEPLENARRRAERAITEDAFFDVRGARVPKSSINTAIDEFDENVNDHHLCIGNWQRIKCVLVFSAGTIIIEPTSFKQKSHEYQFGRWFWRYRGLVQTSCSRWFLRWIWFGRFKRSRC